MKLKLPFKQYKNEHFLFLLPLFFVLHGYMEFYDIVYWKDALVPLLNYLAAIAVVTILMFFVLKNWRKAAVSSFLIFSFHFFFGSAHDIIKEVFGSFFITRYVFILPATLIAFILSFYYFKKTNRSFTRATAYINILLLVFILLDAIQLIPKIYDRHKETAANSTLSFINCDTCASPDIYLIVSDEYAGYQALKETFQFDNRYFEDQLRQRGFHVIKDSRSNYNCTPFSIASLMNMDYLKGIDGDYKSNRDIRVCYRKIDNNLLAKFLKAKNYEIKNLSFFNFAQISTPINSTVTRAKEELITEPTFLSRLDRDIRFNLITKLSIKQEMERVLYADLKVNREFYNQLRNEASNQDTSRPKFIYTHLLMPHHKYYYDKKGNLYTPQKLMTGPKIVENEYLEYLQYCNVQFISLIDAILKESKKPSIILFVSDHGFRNYSQPVDTQYQFMNIDAVYLPNRQYSSFYDGLSNVNLFRVLLNTQFGQKLPLLKDSTIYIKL